MKKEMLESAEQIEISGMNDGSCRLRTPGAEVILSYEAAYDLALRLAGFIQAQDEEESVGLSIVH